MNTTVTATVTPSDILAQYDYIVGCAKQYFESDLYTAQDIAQDVVVKALANPISEGDLRNWLYGITYYTALNHIESKSALKRGGGVSTYSLDEIHYDLLESQNDLIVRSAESEALFQDITPELADALDSLHPVLRETFWLFAVDGLKYKEIADQLDIPISTVGTRINKAREHLKDFLS
jgi:RNA polymerase sigma-70 factor (ECF subfamily)